MARTSVTSGKRGPVGGKPVWYIILLTIVALLIGVLRPKGLVGESEQASQRASEQETDQPEQPLSSPTHDAPRTARTPGRDAGATPAKATTASLGDGGIPRLFAARTSDTWVEATGTVKKVLSDDDDSSGGLHQRWIVRLAGGHEVLIAHDFETGGRVPLKEGDSVNFRGEYEWTGKGGTVHFTHAPKFKRRDPGGWIEHNGRRYE
ncbi:MAG TPA: DUF3465 domain-containing protein [Phycisphaerales bacterium]|nr:DUF3465 domain-containing protein [Phycisphaerales bacterium]